MAQVRIIKKTFTDDNGNITPYKRLALIGSISGETHTLELKLSAAELLAAEMILSSNEELTVATTHTTPDDADAFFKANKGRSADDRIDLNED